MTRRTKLTAVSTLTLLTGIVTMFLYHSSSPIPPFPAQAGFNAILPMATMWNEMGWTMLFGPFAMLLIFGGFVSLTVLLITALTQSLARPD